ncbi:hypothetical protein HOC80_00745 [archaeon]|jgi:thymidine kinase|nr:hypothetical protein [archaeon]MBT4416613.1 hypothetical protein [archaeon]
MDINFHEGKQIYGLVGPMFSGKTLAVLRACDRISHFTNQWQILKPESEFRPELHEDKFPRHYLVSRGFGGKKFGLPGTEVTDDRVDIIPSLLDRKLVRARSGFIALDEANHYDGDLVGLVQELAEFGFSVIFSGLNLDFRGMPFAPVPELLTLATYQEIIKGICMYESGEEGKCKNTATHSQRYHGGEPAPWNSPIKEIGTDQYACVCREHLDVPGRPKKFEIK